MNRIFLAAGLGLIAIGTAGAGPNPSISAATAAPVIVAAADTSAAALDPNDMVLGKKDAPITIIEYASLTCPHCAAFETQTLPQLRKDWIDTGKAKLVFRDFPFDQPGLKAAMLARCSGPDKFYGFLDVLYQNQQQWVLAKDPIVALTRYAKLGGMSDEQVKACLDNKAVSDTIVGYRVAAQKEYGVDSTPTFLINGKKLEGNQPYAEFEKALTAASAS